MSKRFQIVKISCLHGNEIQDADRPEMDCPKCAEEDEVPPFLRKETKDESISKE